MKHGKVRYRGPNCHASRAIRLIHVAVYALDSSGGCDAICHFPRDSRPSPCRRFFGFVRSREWLFVSAFRSNDFSACDTPYHLKAGSISHTRRGVQRAGTESRASIHVKKRISTTECRVCFFIIARPETRSFRSRAVGKHPGNAPGVAPHHPRCRS